MADITFLSAQTANGSSSSQVFTGQEFLTVAVHGTWDTATATFEISLDGGTTWVALSDATFTADGTANISAGNETLVRVTVSSVGASTDLDAYGNWKY